MNARVPAQPSTVSVVLCTRNGQTRGFLGQALDSVLAQSHAPCEILLIDDGSDDDTVAAVSAAYPTVRILANCGRGLASARNTALRAARGAWIAFIDDDDVWHPEKLAQQLGQAHASAAPLRTIFSASSDQIVHAGAAAARPPLRHFARWPACLLGSPLTPSGTLLSTSLLHAVGLFDEGIADGSAYECWIRCLAAGVTIEYSGQILLSYRRHPGQMTSMARRHAHIIAHDALVARHLDKLTPAVATRIGTARLLLSLRAMLRHCGRQAALAYRRTAPLPFQPGWRACTYALLDTLAGRTPAPLALALRRLAWRALLGDQRKR